MTDYGKVRVHLIGDPENVEHRLPVKDIKHVGNEGARSGIAILPDGREVPIYNIIEWGWLWEEQASEELVEEMLTQRLAQIGAEEAERYFDSDGTVKPKREIRTLEE